MKLGKRKKLLNLQKFEIFSMLMAQFCCLFQISDKIEKFSHFCPSLFDPGLSPPNHSPHGKTPNKKE